MSTNNQGNQSGGNRHSLSGSVHARAGETGDVPSSPESRRPRRFNNDEAAAAYAHPDVLCFAAHNRRGRFYIPCNTNEFGGMHVDNVLFDSGCSTLLLPFPLEDEEDYRLSWENFARSDDEIDEPDDL
jgi:hypothetical protein